MIATSTRIAFHDAANIFPLDEDHIAELAEDIKANGLRIPIETLDGKILDGRRRFKACEMSGVTPAFRAIVVDDPIAYVKSLNFHRRHLTPSQLSMVAARAKSYYEAQAKTRMVEGGTRGGSSKGRENLPDPSDQPEFRARDAAGKAFGVSGKSVDFASRVLDKGTPELIGAVDNGRIAVSTAAVVAADPPETQRAFVTKSANRRYYPTKDGNESGRVSKKYKSEVTSEPDANNHVRSKGVGVRRANDAVDCLKRIPKNDSLRARGFQIVTDWIRQNR